MHPETRHPKLRHLLPLLLGALLLSACSNVLPTRDSKPVRQYLLDWQPAGQPAAPAADAPVLRVSPVRAAAGYAGSDLLYARQPHRLEHYARHRWADSPARMLDPLLVKAAEASGLFSAVAAPGSAARADLQLDSQLLALQQQVGDGGSQVQLALRVALIDVDSGRQMAAETFRVSEPAAAAPYPGVEAANRAVAQLLTQLTAFLGQQVAP